MDRRDYTIFLVSSETGKTRKFVIRGSWIRMGLFLITVILITMAAGLLDYFGLLLQAVENKQLRAENAQLEKQLNLVESKVTELENSLERVRTFTTKLRLITNINDQERILKLTMGTRPAANQKIEDYQPLEQRSSREELEKQDPIYQSESPLNEAAGEVSAQESGKDYASLVVRIDKAVQQTQLKEQSVIELWESLSERQSLINAIPNIKPARGWITSRFGYRMNPFLGRPSMHAGLDIAAAPGSPVYAPADGVVIFAAYDESYGKLVSIDHGYGITTRYGHNSQIYVSVGQKVSKYDVIAAVGNTGRSTGPHLHYEVRINGTPVDPDNFILD